MKVGPKSSLRPFLHRALQLLKIIVVQTIWISVKAITASNCSYCALQEE